MEKIHIKSKLVSLEETVFSGKGILKENEIIFYENKVKTKIKLSKNKIIIERLNDYFLKMEFIRSKKTNATYTMGDKCFYLDIFTNSLKIDKNKFSINYDLTLNNDEKMNFIYNVEYSIDS